MTDIFKDKTVPPPTGERSVELVIGPATEMPFAVGPMMTPAQQQQTFYTHNTWMNVQNVRRARRGHGY